MFWNKKKEVVKKHVIEPREEKFTIPQIPEDVVGLRVNKNQFKKTLAASPMEGPYTKDVVVVPETDNHTDIKVAYDPFRVNKQLSKEDEIERYGKTYHEFKSVDELLDTKEYEERISKVEEKTESIGINFGIVYEAEEIIETKIMESVKVENIPVNNPNIHFGESLYKKEEPKISFEPIEVDNEIKEEKDELFAKPIPRVFDFSQTVSNQPVEDNSPKTIIIETEPSQNTGGPIADSTGTRYLGWVWVSEKSIDEEDGST